MGCDKAHAEVAGVSNASRVASLLDSLFEEVLLVGGDPPHDAPGRRVPDGSGPRCALRGLVAALQHAEADRVLVVATDLPLLTADLLLALVAWPQADVVVPSTLEGPQPLCSLYRTDAVLPVAQERLRDGKLAMRGLLEAVSASALGEEDLRMLDAEVVLTNVNTPAELSLAESLIARTRV